MLFYIDAGHGINTAGKRSPDGEREWVFNDKVVRAFITQMATYKNATVVRVDDATGKTDVPLKTRTTKANNAKADCFISFHHNANTAKWGTWTGTEVHVYSKCSNTGEAYKLASKLAPIIANTYGLKNRGVKKTNLHITRETNMTAVLIEGGFMDSTIDIVKLRNNTILANVGKNVADAVASFYGLAKKTVTVKPTTTATTAKPATNAQATDAGKQIHTVVAGDTLYGLSKKYGKTVDELKALNGLTSNTLSIGQKLVVGIKKLDISPHIGVVTNDCPIPIYSKPDGNGIGVNFIKYLPKGSWKVYSIDWTNRMMCLGGNQWIRLADDFPDYMSYQKRIVKNSCAINVYSKPIADGKYYVKKLPAGAWLLYAFDLNTEMVNLGGDQWIGYHNEYVTLS